MENYNEYTTLKHEIRFKDIDPDTGDISQDKLVCYTSSKDIAEYVMALVMKAEEGEPNREYYIKDRIIWED
jgi:hypothetical protein